MTRTAHHRTNRYPLRLFVAVLVAGLCAASALVGCGDGAGDTTTTNTSEAQEPTTTAPAEVVVTEWQIPFLVFLSGPYGGYGEQMKFSVEMAEETVNAEGGIAGVPLNIEFRDTALDPAKATAEVSKAIDEDALTIIGPVAATEAKAAMPTAIENGLFCLAVGTGTEITKEFAPWLISLFPIEEKAIPPAVTAWVEKNPGIKKVAQFTWPLDPTWMYIAEVHTDTLTAQGIEVVDIAVSEGVDMGSVAVKALDLDPDAFIITVGPVEGAKILQELDKRGVTDHGKILFFETAYDPALFDTAGETLDGTYIYSIMDESSEDPRWQDLMQAYQESTGIEHPGVALPFFYDAVYLAKRAIEETGVTGDPAKLAEERLALRDYCQNVTDFESLIGTWDIVDGYAVRPEYLITFENGDPVKVGEYLPDE